MLAVHVPPSNVCCLFRMTRNTPQDHSSPVKARIALELCELRNMGSRKFENGCRLIGMLYATWRASSSARQLVGIRRFHIFFAPPFVRVIFIRHPRSSSLESSRNTTRHSLLLASPSATAEMGLPSRDLVVWCLRCRRFSTELENTTADLHREAVGGGNFLHQWRRTEVVVFRKM